MARVELAIEKISRMPTAYRIRHDLPVSGLRTKNEPPCIIIFRVVGDNEAEVVRIAHDRQDIVKLLTRKRSLLR